MSVVNSRQLAAYVIDTSDNRPSIQLRSLTLNNVARLILLLSRATYIPLTIALDHKPATLARARASAPLSIALSSKRLVPHPPCPHS